MKVRLELGRDCSVYSPDDMTTIIFTPNFLSPKGQCVIGYGEAINDKDEVIDTFDLIVSASTGKVTKKSRTKPVKAFVDMTDEERKAAKEDEE